MSYEDAIRVADLKIRRTRFGRVHEESHATDVQVLQINEFLHPRVDQIADILPVRSGAGCSGPAGSRRRRAADPQGPDRPHDISDRVSPTLRIGRAPTLAAPFASLPTGTAQGSASGSAASPRSRARITRSRYRWPRARACSRDTAILGRGSKNFDAVMGAFPLLRQTPDAASRFRALCQAALADDSGETLAAALR